MEGLSGTQVLYPVLVLEFTGEMRTVEASIPRLNADKGRIYAGRRPQAYNRRVKAEGENGVTVIVIEGDLVDLSVFQDKGVDVEGMGVHGQEAISQFHGEVRIGIYTSLLGKGGGEQAFRAVKAEETTARVGRIMVGEVEGRMCADLEIHVA